MKCHDEQQVTVPIDEQPRLYDNKGKDLRNFSIEFSNLFARSFRTLGKKFVKFALYLFHLSLSDEGKGEQLW